MNTSDPIDTSKTTHVDSYASLGIYEHNPTTTHPTTGDRTVLTRCVHEQAGRLTILADGKSHGGASHIYSIRLDPGGKADQEIACIRFQAGPVKEYGFNGVTDESLLAICIDRLKGFQSDQFACRENAIALTKLQEAMHWLEHRTRDRERRGVEGMNRQ